ncbi:hypothetical protein PFBG_03177 [Plasmodium falciparum 7G8]|uniref:Uncharacterized protein n=2 Tax=Plasmodium falciparum TaxID=5833 RepID=W7FB84_PLAF8|nr:hypothetical protein PFNF135_03251 [Plasmodium falciparum NF135/5.C10]EUR70948.1 hypothetical protein PFBG_03177 [Plasmodium falciparum 7G8]
MSHFIFIEIYNMLNICIKYIFYNCNIYYVVIITYYHYCVRYVLDLLEISSFDVYIFNFIA